MIHVAFLCWCITLLSREVSHYVAPSFLSVHAFSSPTLRVARTSRRGSCRLCEFKLEKGRGRRYPHSRVVDSSQLEGSVVRAMARDESVDAICSTSDSIRNRGQSEYIWEVYISQSSKVNENGMVSTSALIDAFVSLASTVNPVNVYAAVFHKQSKKGKAPVVRCIRRKRQTGTTGIGNADNSTGEIVSALEIANVDSVEKVCRVLTEHMRLGEINAQAFECMKFYFQGNQHLDEGEPSEAIALYSKALSLVEQQPSSQLPKGSILTQRARAYLRKASTDRNTLRTLVRDLADDVPSASTMKILFQTASAHPSMSTPIFNRFSGDSKLQQSKFRKIRYRHDMYKFALLHAVQDSLQSTQLFPHNSEVWFLAGDCLARLRKLKESNQYYRRALEVDPNMDLAVLEGAMEKNRVTQDFMDAAQENGLSGDTLRLAVDVAA